MNYIILNDEEYFIDKITLPHFKEVSKSGRERCDGIFGTITTELLDQCRRDERTRDRFFEKAGLYGSFGIGFMVFKIPQNLLYNDDTKLIKECFGFIDTDGFYTQLWSFKPKNQQWEYFIIGINKFYNYNYLLQTSINENDNSYGIKQICIKIEEIFFGEKK